jgi:uncharacterized protein DUF2199
MHYYQVTPLERERRCSLGSDDCVIDEKFFFVRGCLDIPVHGQEEPFSLGVWVSLSRQSSEEFIRHFNTPKRSYVGPFFGWLSSEIAIYPNTLTSGRGFISETMGSGLTLNSSQLTIRWLLNNATAYHLTASQKSLRSSTIPLPERSATRAKPSTADGRQSAARNQAA